MKYFIYNCFFIIIVIFFAYINTIQDVDNEKEKEESDKEDYFEDMVFNSSRVTPHRPAIKIKLTDSASLGFGGQSYNSSNYVSILRSGFYFN
jgi:hypothetical protein